MSEAKSKDRDLIRQFIAGKDASFELLLNRYRDRVYSYIAFTVRDGDLANDIFQDTFIKVIRSLKNGSYNDEGKFLPWVMRIAHNLVIDHFRRNSRIPVLENREGSDHFRRIASNELNVEKVLVKDQIHKDIKDLVRLLPLEQRQVLIMRIYCEMSFKEIAEQSNVSINTALGRMRYALINLRRLIKEKEIIVHG